MEGNLSFRVKGLRIKYEMNKYNSAMMYGNKYQNPFKEAMEYIKNSRTLLKEEQVKMLLGHNNILSWI